MLRIHEHCVKSVQIRSFSWSVFSRIWTEFGKIGPEKTSYLDIFRGVEFFSEGCFYEKTNYAHKKFLLLVQRHMWKNFALVRSIRKFSSRIPGISVICGGSEKKLSLTGGYPRTLKRKCNKSWRSRWQIKNISVLYLPVMLKQLGKNATFGDIITCAQSICKITWTRPFQAKSTWF